MTLKPCPFCGSKAHGHKDDDGDHPSEYPYSVVCDNIGCSVEIGWHSTQKEANLEWNKRSDNMTKKISISLELDIDGSMIRVTMEEAEGLYAELHKMLGKSAKLEYDPHNPNDVDYVRCDKYRTVCPNAKSTRKPTDIID